MSFQVGTVGADLLIKSDETCRDLVDEAKNYLLLPQERPHMQGPRTRPRKPIRRGEVLFAVGGWCSGDAIASVERHDPQTGVNTVNFLNKRGTTFSNMDAGIRRFFGSQGVK